MTWRKLRTSFPWNRLLVLGLVSGSCTANVCDVNVGGPSAIPSVQGSYALAMHVPMALKEKVWGGQFVDFAAYIYFATMLFLRWHMMLAPPWHYSLAVEGNQVGPYNRLMRLRTKLILLIDGRVLSMHSCPFIPNAIQVGAQSCSVKYAETVKTASLQFPGFGWRSYDKQFRLRQAVNPARSWAELDMELWVTVAAASALVPVHAGAGNHGDVRSIFNQGRAGHWLPGWCYSCLFCV